MRLALAGGGPFLSVFNQDALTDMAADCVAFFGNLNTGIHGSTVLTEVKLASIGADGKYTDEPFVEAVSQAGGWTQGAVLHPYQVSLAVSLDTDRRGASGRGRIYLPTPGFALQTDSTIQTVHAEGVRDQVATLLTNLNNNAGFDTTDTSVVIASSKGFNSPVTSVRVGRLLDTVRSRRRSLGEKYSASAAVT